MCVNALMSSNIVFHAEPVTIASAHFVSLRRNNFPTSLRGIDTTKAIPPLIFL